MKSLLFVPLLLAAVPAEAALSGFYDSAEQINALLASPALADALHQAPIKALSNSGSRADGAREWTVESLDCRLKVYLRPVPPPGVGKMSYQLEPPPPCP